MFIVLSHGYAWATEILELSHSEAGILEGIPLVTGEASAWQPR